MSQIEYVEVARARSERGEVVLRSRRDEDDPVDSPVVFELRVNGVFLMDTRETTSEEALAARALAEVADPRSVLIGGLGLGYTAHAVLADHRVGHVNVVEIEDALVAWMRDGTIPHGPSCLADSRLSVCIGDIRQVVAESAPASYDLVLLDVDNGPGFLVYDENAEVYEPGFLTSVKQVTRLGGAVAVWSASEEHALAEAMTEVFGECLAIPLPVTLQGREDTYWLYLANR